MSVALATPTVPRRRRSESMRASYKHTSRRLIGFPMMIESSVFDLPLTADDQDRLDGFREAADDCLYVVAPSRAGEGKLQLRAWCPRIRLLAKRPIEESDLARLTRASLELAALGFRVEWTENDVQVELRAARPRSEEASSA